MSQSLAEQYWIIKPMRQCCWGYLDESRCTWVSLSDQSSTKRGFGIYVAHAEEQNMGCVWAREKYHIFHPRKRDFGFLLWVFGQHWPCYNGTTLHIYIWKPCSVDNDFQTPSKTVIGGTTGHALSWYKRGGIQMTIFPRPSFVLIPGPTNSISM